MHIRDPCLYIMRFANRLQLGSKTHEVSMTALRIVQRMKKDCMHSGRRPTGLCGAALLIAARMHDFNRTIVDIVGVVKIHESTLRKRLSEFAETPSSGLTLEEFMTVDLEREQDPPSFKAARKKDRERIKDIGEFELTELQRQIDAHLEKDLEKNTNTMLRKLTKFTEVEATDKGSVASNRIAENEIELEESRQFIEQSNAEVIQHFIDSNTEQKTDATHNMVAANIEGLRPDIEAICRVTQSDLEDVERAKQSEETELYVEDLNDDELDQYVLTEEEALTKMDMWKNLNAEYLQKQKEREELLAKEREEGKPERKKRKPRRKPIGPSTTAGEAIEKMLQEKKISNKINYDILKTLTEGMGAAGEPVASGSDANSKPITLDELQLTPIIVEEGPIKTKRGRIKPAFDLPGPSRKRGRAEASLPTADLTPKQADTAEPAVVLEDHDDAEYDDVDEADDVHVEPEAEPEATLHDMLNKGAVGDDDEYGYGFEEEEY
ncbi:transcription factor IIIB 90 kDa subunit isoform X2 [Scaptodrosophila lebanonensis]|uniref:Transcription factor IIIB 90 kDa subunit isoform X2 n=1 Tax=Drosophila lebanonensis TaxID=7225 RepID=A0A6J2SXI6_DROLE|nr:transcription factor IIIB 90 kDa subunit isoform X2 [Scaptodrosophila lebanonensis]